MEMQEIWKDVVGWEGLYLVSNLGNVKSLDRTVQRGKMKSYHRKGRLLKPHFDNGKYKCVWLCNSKYRKYKKIHRLVAEAFHENKQNLYCVNHIDGNKSNNCVDNLEWCSSSDNQKHAYKIGLRIFSDEKKLWAKHWGKKNVKHMINLNRKKVIDIETGRTFNSLTEASIFIGIELTHLSCMLRGKITNKTNLKYV